METKNYRVQLKMAADEPGTFEGCASPYGVVDDGQDIVERGAFAKTLSENGPTFPLLWCHDLAAPIGTVQLTDSLKGLMARGRLVLSVPKACEAHDLMLAGAVKGLSIGFQAIKEVMEAGIRHLKEIRLYEISLTPMPMNAEAVVTAVKQHGADERAICEQIEAFTREIHRLTEETGR